MRDTGLTTASIWACSVKTMATAHLPEPLGGGAEVGLLLGQGFW